MEFNSKKMSIYKMRKKLYNLIKLIKSGGGTGPLKPSNLLTVTS